MGANAPPLTWALERWMATRQQEQEQISVHDDRRIMEPFDQISTVPRPRPAITVNKRFDLAVVEKASCGSNDAWVNVDASSVPCQTPRIGCPPDGTRKLKTMRRKTMPDYHRNSQPSKVSIAFFLKRQRGLSSATQMHDKESDDARHASSICFLKYGT